MSHPVFEHDGPWTEAAYLALEGEPPPEQEAGPQRGPGGDLAPRIELLDGSLLLGPAPDDSHRATVARVRDAVSAALPEGLAVSGPVALRVAPGRILRPDLVVTTGPVEGADPLDPARVVQVLEVAAPGNALADRWLKPQLYAEAGIPYYLRVERDSPVAVACLLIGGRYLEHVRTAPGEVLSLADPFPVTIDLAPDTSQAGAEVADPAGRAADAGG